MKILKIMGKVMQNIRKGDRDLKSFATFLWLCVFVSSISIVGISAALFFGTSILQVSLYSVLICGSTGIVSVPLTLLFIIYLVKSRDTEVAENARDGLLSPFLVCAQEYLFFTDWDLERFRKEITYHMGMDEWEFEEGGHRNLTNLIFLTNGFNIDHKFESGDLVHTVAESLQPLGIAISQDLSKDRYDVVIDKTTYRRKTNLIVGELIHELNFETPEDLAREINKLIVPLGFRLLMNELDGDTYEFLFVRNELARRILGDKTLTVSKI